MSKPERIPEDRMPGLLRPPHPDVPLGVYEHIKSGHRYMVVGGTFLATGEDQIVHVQYVCPEHGYSAHRTPEDFLEPQTRVGETFPTARFTCVQPMDGLAVVAFLLRVLVANLGNTLWRFITSPTKIDETGGSPSSPSDAATAT